MPEEFILTSTPLPTGKMLIEASAGTGKTYSLIGIILRLIIEEGISLKEILVVTFTDAATAELKERVRSGLVSLRAALQSDTKPTDEFEQTIWHGYKRNDEAIRRLKSALEVFDRASISTIHGFCSSALSENAFESGSLFDTEVITDENELIEEVANDYWRSHVIARFRPGEKITSLESFEAPSKLKNIIRELLKIDPAKVKSEWDALCSPLLEFAQKQGPALIEALRSDNGFDKRRFKARETVALFLEELLKNSPNTIKPAKICAHSNAFNHLTWKKISETSINFKPESAKELCEQAESFNRKYKNRRFNILSDEKIGLHKWASERLYKTKATRNLMTFDDMILKMRDAVESSEILVDSLRERYKVALIDEFQDTDSVQLAIFQKVFSTNAHRLYCVGDPKQSIYKFRGGDLETYLSVCGDETDFKRYSLKRNYRSDKAVIEAVNAIFSYRDVDHFTKDIPFTPAVHPGGDGKQVDEYKPAFILRYLGEQAFQSQVAEAVVRETLFFKQEHNPARDASLGKSEDPFSFSKVAVLVNSHAQARAVANAYQAAGIPSIRKIDESVFSTEAAIILRIALNGVLQCGRVKPLKAALATPLFGRTNREIVQLDKDDDLLNKEMDALHEYRRLWQEQGFMVAFQRILSTEKVRQRLLKQPGGGESLSLYLHIAELLHAYTQHNQLSPEALLQHLADSIKDNPLSEATKIRRSTDTDAVTISTIHSAKGLEYEYVIVPFAWQQAHKNNDPEENMRKLYVTTTRAKHRCTVLLTNYFHGANITNISALAAILGGPKNEDIGRFAKDLCQRSNSCLEFIEGLPEVAPEVLERGLQRNALASNIPDPPELKPCRIITSFSSLKKSAKEVHKSDGQEPALAPDVLVEDPSFRHEDDAVEPDAELASASGRDADPMPRGAAIGRAVHSIFENIDFSDTGSIAGEVGSQLEREGFKDEKVSAYLMERFPKWLVTPLCKEGDLRLENISKDKRTTELEFHFPQNGIQPGQVAKAIAPEDWPELSEKVAGIKSLGGFIKGYIDLVFEHDGTFCIADWKTNYLGEAIVDYEPEKLRDSMLEALYPLQVSDLHPRAGCLPAKAGSRVQLQQALWRRLLCLPARVRSHTRTFGLL